MALVLSAGAIGLAWSDAAGQSRPVFNWSRPASKSPVVTQSAPGFSKNIDERSDIFNRSFFQSYLAFAMIVPQAKIRRAGHYHLDRSGRDLLQLFPRVPMDDS